MLYGTVNWRVQIFKQLVHAFVDGRVKDFFDLLDANEDWFVRSGVLLVLERLRPFIFRNLFKKLLAFAF